MGLDDVAADRKSQSGAAFRAAAGLVDPEEPLEQVGQHILRHAGGAVLEVDEDLVVPAPGCDRQLPSRIGVAQAVLEQIVQ